jgi:hypothetical protein
MKHEEGGEGAWAQPQHRSWDRDALRWQNYGGAQQPLKQKAGYEVNGLLAIAFLY